MLLPWYYIALQSQVKDCACRLRLPLAHSLHAIFDQLERQHQDCCYLDTVVSLQVGNTNLQVISRSTQVLREQESALHQVRR
jgi:hypothetical protein